MGVEAALFIILIIPEFWKSQTYQSMEIETASYFSLRQIYSARMLLFGIVDILLITFFCWLSFAALNVTLSQILVQFIFPMAVTACICFGMLCSKHPFSETVAVMMCIGWSGIWMFIVSREAKMQGFDDIRNMINRAFCAFRQYDYYRIDGISEKEVRSLYDRRSANFL